LLWYNFGATVALLTTAITSLITVIYFIFVVKPKTV